MSIRDLYSDTLQEMPEGHTIHRISRDHNQYFAGQKVLVSSPQGRFQDEADSLCGHKMLDVEAHGKHLFYRWSRNRYVHIHLGLYGKFRLHKNPPPEPRGAVRIRLVGKEKSFDLNGPNRCELLDKAGYQKIRNRLGPDPLRDDAEPEIVWERIRKSRAAIGSLLLNQSVIAGVGNVYRAEILFLLGIHPERKGCDLTREEFDAVWELTAELLNIGVKYNRIITVDRSKAGKPLSRLKNRERLVCYKKQNCSQCQHPIRKWDLANRSMFACDQCQA